MKTMMQYFISVLLGLCLMAGSAAAHGTDKDHTHSKNQEGIDTADLWLTFVDKGAYSTSWQTAARIFKSQVSAAQWEAAAGSVRGPLGNLKDRQLFHDKFTRTLPGMPDGRYLIIRYKTSFENKAGTVETVTLVQGPEDDTWRVAGYFIK